jgi:hypothetical protein
MEDVIFFKEKQGFNQGWLRFLMPALVSIAVIISIIQFYTNDDSLAEAIVAIILFAILTAILFTIQMKTEIKAAGIYVQFAPFQRKPSFYPWENIRAVYIRQYNPLQEYGGWGMRSGLMGRGTAYNISGTIGIQLVFKNGKRHLIGTRQPHKAAEALKRLGKLSVGE